MSSGMTVTFNDPRRFGVMDLVPANRLEGHEPFGRMGPEPLSRAFDARALASRCANRRVALKVALLDQRIVAGIGNIYASEALHLARLSPFRPAATLATAQGAPRPGAERLAAAIKAVLKRAIRLTGSERYGGSRFRVYDREGQPCPTPGCRGLIARRGRRDGRRSLSGLPAMTQVASSQVLYPHHRHVGTRSDPFSTLLVV
jgi:formamidopyrimidine-DNA glycosylase